ncbi:MAG: trehalose-phosphatase [Chloroflexota bacterium]
MPYLFDHLDIIGEALRRSPFGLMTDIDGTISPIAPTPQAAAVSPLCRRYLGRLARRLPLVAALSGRPVRQVREMLQIRGVVCIGNHGMERWRRGRRQVTPAVRPYLPVIRAVIRELSPLEAIEGLWIEDKEISASLHYRLCPRPEAARQAILAALEGSPLARGLRIQEQRRAIELLPPVAVDKGTAVRGLIEEYRLQGAVYLGDDTTDVDAFRAVHAAVGADFRGYALGVINPETSSQLLAEADFSLDGVADVERFLRWLTENVPPPG